MNNSIRGRLAAVAALAVGPENCDALLGVNWRWTRDTAARLGVKVWRIGGKSLIPAETLFRALEREAEALPVRVESEEEESAAIRAQVRQMLRVGVHE